MWAMIGAGLSAVTGAVGFFSGKKAQKEAEELASAQRDLDYQNAEDVYQQRQDEISGYEDSADAFIGSQKAQQGASGAENSGSALLASVTSENNKIEGIGTLNENADTERQASLDQADLNYQAGMSNADAIGTQATASLLGGVASVASLGSEIFGGDIDTTLTSSATSYNTFGSTNSTFYYQPSNTSTLGAYTGNSSEFDTSNVGFEGFF